MRILPFRDQKWLMILIFGVPISAGILAVIGTNLMSHVDRSTIKESKIALIEIGKKIQSYQSDCGHLPASDTGLSELLEKRADCPNWKEPYLTKIPTDPWGRPIIYRVDGTAFTLKSLGRDGKEGGEGYNADIMWSCDTSNPTGCDFR